MPIEKSYDEIEEDNSFAKVPNINKTTDNTEITFKQSEL